MKYVLMVTNIVDQGQAHSPQPIDIGSRTLVPRHSGSGRTFVTPTDDITFYPLKSSGTIMINMYVRCGMIIKCSGRFRKRTNIIDS